MFKFKKTYPTPAEHTKGTNTCEYIVIHHTGTKEWTINGVLDGLYRRADYASCHFVVDINWDCYKLGDPKDILWHAWVSSWKWKTNLNLYSIGIEIIWPLSNGGFTKEQMEAVRALIQHLMWAFNIPAENVIRHRDIAPRRKVDVADSFWKIDTWQDYQKTLIPQVQPPVSKFYVP